MTGHILSMILGIAVLVLLRFLPLVLYGLCLKRIKESGNRIRKTFTGYLNFRQRKL